MRVKTSLKPWLAAGLLVSTSAAQASLIDRGGGMIFDTDLNITWLADANYAKTSGYAQTFQSLYILADGSMNWGEANTWANNLVYAGYTDWRLPTTLQPDASCGAQSNIGSYGGICSGSEMGHLFNIELGGTPNRSILVSNNPVELAKFTNIQAGYYWSGTEWASIPISYAWAFGFGNNYQMPDNKGYTYYAWAVRDGDVAVVPVSAAVWLFGSGLLALLGVARRRTGVSSKQVGI